MSWIADIFSLDTLDQSLVTVSEDERKQTQARAHPSLWRTKEFYVYYLVFLFAVPLMFYGAITGSNEHNINYPRYARLLRQGWILDRRVDLSDPQYASFRNNIRPLLIVAGVHQVLRLVFSRITSRVGFDLGFGLLFIFGLHGTSILKLLGIFGINFLLVRNVKGPLAIYLVWAFGIGILFFNEWTLDYRFGNVLHILKFLDFFRGIMPRWEVYFNFSVLRMISFSMDYYWARQRKFNSKKLYHGDGYLMDEKERVDVPLELSDYNFRNYIAYSFYAPLYIAGPIITFNDYIHQCRNKSIRSFKLRSNFLYCFRLVLDILVMEFLLHFMYVVAQAKVKAWTGNTSFQLSMLAYFNLIIIWLKLLIPWRFFRLWALVDGIKTPENMVRCMSDNYSALAFWRSWHRSFNKWVVRYIYIPMGGRKYPIINTLAVFTFVALWHDIQLHLLMWGWLVTLFILPEVAATKLFPPKAWSQRPIYRHICAIGAVANIWMMMVANLVGFALGLDGLRELLHNMLHTRQGLIFSATTSAVLFVGVQVMFELREAEARRGINLRY